MRKARFLGIIIISAMGRLFTFSLLAGLLIFSKPATADELLNAPGPSGALEGQALIVPDAKAGIIIIPGSGPTDRNGNGPAGLKSNSYKLLAEGLSDRGYSTLRIDKRGFFGSAAAISNPEDATIEDYAEDVGLWLDRFAKRINTNCIWIAGHSEGGLVALVAAARGFQPCGIILLSTPGRKIAELMRVQFRNNPANAPYLVELERLVTGLENGRYQDINAITPILRPLFRRGLQRYMMQLFTYNPTEIARSVSLPTLVLQGGKDLQVTPDDARRLFGALANAELVLLPEVTHMLKSNIPDSPLATYQNPGLPLEPKVITAISRFIESSQGK